MLFSFSVSKAILTHTLTCASVLILFGCAQPTERGQQYLDGKLETTLERTDQIESEAPRDFETFAAQAKK